MTTTKYNVIKNSGSFQDMVIGIVSHQVNVSQGDGWVYIPFSQSTRSRKTWDTPEDALKGRVKDYRLEEK